MSAEGYWAASRAHRYSLLFALPLLLAYEALAAALADPGAGGVRNGADVLLKGGAYLLAGVHGPLILMGGVIVAALWLVWRDLRRQRELRVWVFLAMAGEALTLALLFGLVVGTLTAQLLGQLGMLHGAAVALQAGPTPTEQMGWSTRLMLSLGAGLYEELLFRVTLVAALANGARLALGWSRRAAGILATLVGALIFSAFHYVGPYGDPLELASFTYRAIAGVAFSALYLTRGFGITAWTHALYDVYVLLL